MVVGWAGIQTKQKPSPQHVQGEFTMWLVDSQEVKTPRGVGSGMFQATIYFNKDKGYREWSMSNANILDRMREASDQFESGDISSAALGDQIVALAKCLEHVGGVSRNVLTEAEEFRNRLISIDDYLEIPVNPAMDQFEYVENENAPAESQAIIADIRVWLAGMNPG
jgi:hypothetical protein